MIAETGPGTEAAMNFRARRTTGEFIHAGTGKAGIDTAVIGAQEFIDAGNGAIGQSGHANGAGGHSEAGHSNDHSAQPGTPNDSYHMREFGYFGVQRRDVARDTQGWRTYEEQR